MGAEHSFRQVVHDADDPGQFVPPSAEQKIAKALANPTLAGLAQLLQAWYTRLSEHYRGQGMDLEANVFSGVADEFSQNAQEYDRLGCGAPSFGDAKTER